MYIYSSRYLNPIQRSVGHGSGRVSLEVVGNAIGHIGDSVEDYEMEAPGLGLKFGKLLRGVAGFVGGTLIGGPIAGAVAASAAASKKPLVKLAKIATGAATGFVTSGFNPLGAVLGGGSQLFAGGKVFGKTTLVGGAAGGMATYLLPRTRATHLYTPHQLPRTSGDNNKVAAQSVATPRLGYDDWLGRNYAEGSASISGAAGGMTTYLYTPRQYTPHQLPRTSGDNDKVAAQSVATPRLGYDDFLGKSYADPVLSRSVTETTTSGGFFSELKYLLL